jgi:hypothetical protein
MFERFFAFSGNSVASVVPCLRQKSNKLRCPGLFQSLAPQSSLMTKRLANAALDKLPLQRRRRRELHRV